MHLKNSDNNSISLGERLLSSAHELGERKIIELIINALDRMPNMVLPFGDDVSAVDIGHGQMAVVKVDMLVGKTDVPAGMSAWQAARKAVVMNVSDLAAKGVQPSALLTSIGIPPDCRRVEIEQIAAGLNTGAREYGAYVLGGDTNETSDLIIDCLLFGICQRKDLMTRSGAKPGDILAVTGRFGNPAVGLKILLGTLEVQPKLKERVLKSIYLPNARLKEGLALGKTGAVTASIDSSDGLAWSLYELSKMSGVGFILETVPITTETQQIAKIHNLDANSLALYGGEEYELVVTINPKKWGKACMAIEKVGGELLRIGLVTRKTKIVLRSGKKELQIEPKGWEHFRLHPTQMKIKLVYCRKGRSPWKTPSKLRNYNTIT